MTEESYTIRYKTPREMLGNWLARNSLDKYDPEYFNQDQREFWNKKADKLILFCKEKGLML